MRTVLQIHDRPAPVAPPPTLQVNNFEVRLAKNEAELDAAQALRYSIFRHGMNGIAFSDAHARQRDIDGFDAVCDHLLVIDRERSNGSPHIVGTYRLLRRSVASHHGGFYSASEFDLSPLDLYPGEILELGRSCVAPEYRGRAIMQILWRGIAEYVLRHDIPLMFGCASFPGTDPQAIAESLSFLNANCLAPEAWRPRALPERYLSLGLRPEETIEPRRALAAMPPLIKGYLRLGGRVGDGAVIDSDFRTVDVCMLVETSHVTDKYFRHYALSDPTPGPN